MIARVTETPESSGKPGTCYGLARSVPATNALTEVNGACVEMRFAT